MVMLYDIPDEIFIIGSGAVGVELAVILNYVGTKVTLEEKADRILPMWDGEISSQMYIYSIGSSHGRENRG